MKTWLSSHDGEISSTDKSGTFAHLLDLADATVEHYRSDFYHDALWVAEHVDGPMTFLFSFDEMGTNIGTDVDPSWYRSETYQITVSVDRGKWEVSSERLGA